MIHARVAGGGGQVEIAQCFLDSDADIVLEDAYALLDAQERERAEAFVFDRDRDRFVRAHGFLRCALADFVEAAPRSLTLAADAGGKPFAPGQGAEFNLSHSGPYAVLAMTRGQPIGIDIETLDNARGDDLSDLYPACLVDDEQQALARLPADRQRQLFLSYWTAKEARMKLTGEGLTLEPTSIALKLLDGHPIGYRQPDLPCAEMQFVPLSWSNTICCLAIGADAASGAAGWHRP